MPALRRPDISAWRGTLAPRRLLKFASVGLAATILYALCACLFTSAGSSDLSPATASVAAYAVAAIFPVAQSRASAVTRSGCRFWENPMPEKSDERPIRLDLKVRAFARQH
jgi:hypothetical protein